MDEETTNPVEGVAVPEPEVEAVLDEQLLDDDGNPIEEPEPEEELEEIEHDGKKAKIPAWLKPQLMMQADYTRKTQELAEQRKSVEAEAQRVQQASADEINAIARITSIDDQLNEFGKIDWDAWHDQDPFESQKAFVRYSQLKDHRQQMAGYLGQVRQQKTFAQQQASAQRLEQGAAELARDIKDWSPETGAKLKDFAAKRFGFDEQFLDGVDDPRLVKVLHAAFQWEEHSAKTKKAQQHVAAQAVKPAATVGRSSSPTAGLDDRLSVDEWTRRREAQLRKRA